MPGNPFASRIDLKVQRSLHKDDDYRPELKQTTPFELSLISWLKMYRDGVQSAYVIPH